MKKQVYFSFNEEVYFLRYFPEAFDNLKFGRERERET
jgi:hypothetical protein